MDYSTQLLTDSTAFASTNYVNLKLKSPSPSPFQESSTTNGSPSASGLSNYKLEMPSKLLKEVDISSLDDSISSISDHETALRKTVSKLDIYKHILGLTVGKDKMTKVLSYLLNIIKHYLTTTRRLIVDEKFTNLSINPLEHYRTPLKYIKLLLFLNSTALEKKITILTSNISLFRFAMRFGGTPYRVRAILFRLKTFIKNPSTEHFQSVFVNEEFLGEFINFYYGIMDELLLLCKLGVLTNVPLRNFVGKHVDRAWYYDILLGLKQNWCALQENRNKQIQLNIQDQVRQRASLLSKRLVDSIGHSPLRSQILKEFNNKSPSGHQSSHELQLQELKHQEKMIKLDLCKYICDFACDSVDVFDLKVHRLAYLTSGLFSGIFGLSKVCVNAKRELQK